MGHHLGGEAGGDGEPSVDHRLPAGPDFPNRILPHVTLLVMIGVRGLAGTGYLALPRPRLSRTLRRMVRAPVPRDLAARGEPHLPASLRMLEEAREPPGPRRTTRDAAVQTDRHHARVRAALLPELVEGVAKVRGEII